MHRFYGLADTLTDATLLVVWVLGLYALSVLVVFRLLTRRQSAPRDAQSEVAALLVAALFGRPRPPDERVLTIGYGPVLAEFCLGATRYRLKLVPLGTAFTGIEFRSAWQRLAFELGAPLIPLGVVFVSLWVFIAAGVRVPDRPGALVTYAAESLPLGDGDVVTRAGGREVGDGLDLARELTRWRAGPLTLEVERDGVPRAVTLERTPEGVTRPGLAFRTVTRVEQPGPLSALAATPRTAMDVYLYHYRDDLTDDRDLWTRAGVNGEFVFTFLVWAPLMLTAFMLAEGVSRGVLVGVENRLEARGRAARWGGVLVTAQWVILVGLAAGLVLGPLWYGQAAGRSLFDTPFLTDALRRLPSNVYWSTGV